MAIPARGCVLPCGAVSADPPGTAQPSAARAEEETRDLGFGAVVSRESGRRLLNTDGSFNVERRGLHFWASLSLYHTLVETTWPRFMALLVTSYVGINLLFAFAFLVLGPWALESLGGSTLDRGLLRAFFFSVETFSTIGYGNISPVGLAAHLLVTLESVVGLLWVALATGLIFARFSRPTARILFSDVAVIAPYRDITALEFRIANGRKGQIIEVEAQVLFSRMVTDGTGRRARRYDPLELERKKVVFFPLTWTVVHPIDKASPLHGLTPRDLAESDAEILILLSGIDETFAQTVHARTSYKPSELVWNARFATVFAPHGESEPISVDVGRLSEIERY